MTSPGDGQHGSWYRFFTGRRRLLFIFVLALAVRVAYFFQIRSNESFRIIALDTELFDHTALDILHGGFWGTGVFHSAPLYPYFLALIYGVFGPGFLGVRIVQLVLGALTAVLIVRLAERTFDEPVPLLAGLIAALYGPFIFFNATILGTTLDVLLVTLSVLLFTFHGEGRRRELWVFVAGASVGLASLSRPNTVIVLPLWVLCLAFLRWRDRWIKSSAALLLGGVLVIAPVTIRNAIVGHDFVPIASHGGINFWIGNHPGALGTFDLPPGIRGTPEQVNLIDSTRLAVQAAGHPLKPSQVSSYWFRKGLEYIRDNPAEAVALFGRKIRMFWNRIEIPLNVNFHFLRRSSPLLRIPLMHFGLISPLSILGMALALGRWRKTLPSIALVLAYFASAVAFFVSARYRLPAVPLLIVFASYAICWMGARLAAREWKPLGVALIVLVPLFVQAYVPVAGFSVERSFGRDYYYLATECRSQGRIPEALKDYEESLRYNPDFWMSYNGLGVCLSEMGKIDEAVAMFEKAIRLEPTRSEAWTNLGIALANHGRVAEAMAKWEKALEINPDDENARTNLERARRLTNP